MSTLWGTDPTFAWIRPRRVPQGVAGTVTGALAGSTPPLSGALTGDVIDSGALAGTTPPLTGALTGDVIDSGALAGTTPPLIGALSTSGTTTGALAGATPRFTGALTGTAALPQLDYPLHAGAVTDNVARYRAGAPVMNYGRLALPAGDPYLAGYLATY